MSHPLCPKCLDCWEWMNVSEHYHLDSSKYHGITTDLQWEFLFFWSCNQKTLHKPSRFFLYGNCLHYYSCLHSQVRLWPGQRVALFSAIIVGTKNRDNLSGPFVYHTKLPRGLSHCLPPSLNMTAAIHMELLPWLFMSLFKELSYSYLGSRLGRSRYEVCLL